MKTNSCVFLMLFFLFVIQDLSAQKRKKSQWVLGGSSGIEFIPDYRQTHQYATTLGVFANIRNADKFSLSPAVFFAQRNFTTKKEEFREDGLTLELRIKYNFSIRKFHCFVGVGPFVRYSLRIFGNEFSNNNTSPFVTPPYFESKEIDRFNGYSISSGLNMKVSKLVFVAPVVGWNKSFEFKTSDTRKRRFISDSAKNNFFFKLQLGYIFRQQKK